MQNTLHVKRDKNILLVPFKRVRGYYLGQVLCMSLHKVRIDNNVYTGMMDTCNIQISKLTSLCSTIPVSCQEIANVIIQKY